LCRTSASSKSTAACSPENCSGADETDYQGNHLTDEGAFSGSRRPDGGTDARPTEALETPIDSGVVQTATSVLRAMELDERPCGVPFGCDASKLSLAGIPSIVFGPEASTAPTPPWNTWKWTKSNVR